MDRRVLVYGVTTAQTLNAFVFTQVRPLVQLGWEVHVVASGASQCTPVEGIVLHHLPMKRTISPIRDVISLAHWVRLLRSIQPSTVIAGTPKATLLAIVAARSLRVPNRVSRFMGAQWDGKGGLRANVVRLADRTAVSCSTEVQAVSPSLANLLLASGVCSSRPTVLGAGSDSGVDTQVFTPHRRTTGDRPPTIVFVGRIAIDKGIEDLLSMYNRLRTKVPELQLTLAGGTDPTDRLPAHVLDAIASDPTITWLGEVDNPAEAMRSADLMLTMSRREGLGLAILEGASCEVPSVGWDVTGVRDAIVHEMTGLLAPLDDFEAFYEAALSLLTDDKKRGQLGASARLRVIREFERESVVRLFADHINSFVP